MSILRVRRGLSRFFQTAFDFQGHGVDGAPTAYSDVIQPTVDGEQNGWAHDSTVTAPFNWQTSTNAGGIVLDLLTGTATTTSTCPQPDSSLQFFIHSCQVNPTGERPLDVFIALRPAGGNLVRVRGTTVPRGASVGSLLGEVAAAKLLPPAGMFVPPGFRAYLALGTLATLATATLTVTGVYTQMRAGFAGGAP